MRQLSEGLKKRGPRVHNILNKTNEMIVWTPIIVMVYGSILSLTYSYYKSNSMRSK